MKTITLEEYNKHPYKDIWTLPEYSDLVGKKTMLGNEKGATVILIEGIDFEIKSNKDIKKQAKDSQWPDKILKRLETQEKVQPTYNRLKDRG